MDKKKKSYFPKSLASGEGTRGNASKCMGPEAPM